MLTALIPAQGRLPGRINARSPDSPLQPPVSAAYSSKTAPPATIRAAPTETGLTPAGANDAAVPVLPHSAAATRTAPAPPALRVRGPVPESLRARPVVSGERTSMRSSGLRVPAFRVRPRRYPQGRPSPSAPDRGPPTHPPHPLPRRR